MICHKSLNCHSSRGPLFFLLCLHAASRDFHIGGDSPHSDPGVAFDFIASVADVFASVAATTGTPQLRGAVLEENGSRHDVQRALGHARMSNRMHCLGDVVRVDAPANGLQVAGRNDK